MEKKCISCRLTTDEIIKECGEEDVEDGYHLEE